MTLLHEAVEAKKFDVRLVERNTSRGVVTTKDVETSLKQLPDDAANAEYVAIDSFIDSEDSPSNANH